jgi:hypothetical protein
MDKKNMPDYYKSQNWLSRKYNNDKWTAKQIGEYCNVDEATVYRWLVKFGIIKSRTKRRS